MTRLALFLWLAEKSADEFSIGAIVGREVLGRVELIDVDSIGGDVKHLVDEAASTSDKSPETAKDVEKAGVKVFDQIEEVRGAAETGNKLDGEWVEMDKALHNFRKALAAHVVAVTGGPDCVNGWHLPG